MSKLGLNYNKMKIMSNLENNIFDYQSINCNEIFNNQIIKELKNQYLESEKIFNECIDNLFIIESKRTDYMYYFINFNLFQGVTIKNITNGYESTISIKHFMKYYNHYTLNSIKQNKMI